MSTIKLMADYECWPLWTLDPPDNVDPSELPLSDDLRAELEAWASRYDATLDRGDPAASGFATDRERQAFDEDGRRLWRRLADELGTGTTVVYWSEAEQRLLTWLAGGGHPLPC